MFTKKMQLKHLLCFNILILLASTMLCAGEKSVGLLKLPILKRFSRSSDLVKIPSSIPSCIYKDSAHNLHYCIKKAERAVTSNNPQLYFDNALTPQPIIELFCYCYRNITVDALKLMLAQATLEIGERVEDDTLFGKLTALGVKHKNDQREFIEYLIKAKRGGDFEYTNTGDLCSIMRSACAIISTIPNFTISTYDSADQFLRACKSAQVDDVITFVNALELVVNYDRPDKEKIIKYHRRYMRYLKHNDEESFLDVGLIKRDSILYCLACYKHRGDLSDFLHDLRSAELDYIVRNVIDRMVNQSSPDTIKDSFLRNLRYINAEVKTHFEKLVVPDVIVALGALPFTMPHSAHVINKYFDTSVVNYLQFGNATQLYVDFTRNFIISGFSVPGTRLTQRTNEDETYPFKEGAVVEFITASQDDPGTIIKSFVGPRHSILHASNWGENGISLLVGNWLRNNFLAARAAGNIGSTTRLAHLPFLVLLYRELFKNNYEELDIPLLVRRLQYSLLFLKEGTMLEDIVEAFNGLSKLLPDNQKDNLLSFDEFQRLFPAMRLSERRSSYVLLNMFFPSVNPHITDFDRVIDRCKAVQRVKWLFPLKQVIRDGDKSFASAKNKLEAAIGDELHSLLRLFEKARLPRVLIDLILEYEQ